MKTSDNRQEAVLDRILEKKGLVPQNTPDTEGGCCKGCKTATNKSEWDKGNVYCSNRECKCHTPDTEWEAKMLVETLHSILADISSFEPDGEVYTLVEQAHTELAKLRTLLTSRDTYWKEMVRKEVEGIRKPETTFLKEGDETWDYSHIIAHNLALDTLLDNLK